jgi:hypothetical protein
MVTIKSVKYAPKVSNSVLLLFASNENIDLTKLEKLIGGLNYDMAVKLFCYAVNRQGGNLTPEEVHEEVDQRIEAFQELITYIAMQLNPQAVGERKPVKAGKQR